MTEQEPQKEIEGFVIPDTVQGHDLRGTVEISHIHLKEPTIFFNEADVKEKTSEYIGIKIKVGN